MNFNKVVGTIIKQFRTFFKDLSPIKRGSLVASLIIFMVASVITMTILLKTDYVTLFKDVAPDRLPFIVSKLQEKNVPFKLVDNGSIIEVPKQFLPSTQMSLMSELGDSTIGSMGLELFEKEEFGVTAYAQKIKYQRALQGELIRAINSLSVVKQSKVILALPTKKTFLEESERPSASVVVDLHFGKVLRDDQVRGITHLVASAVERLEAENITIVNSKGKVLSKNYKGDIGISSELVDLRKKLESDMEQRVEEILIRAVGRGNVIVRVNAKINPKSTNSVVETVDPDRTAIRSNTTEEEKLDGSRSNPAGIPGARSNIPGAEDAGRVGFQQNVRKELKTVNYDVPKTVSRIRESAGELERLGVAVLIDFKKKLVTSEAGETTETWVAHDPEFLKKMENLVKSAVGFSANRGDSIKIENVKFEKESFEDSQKFLDELTVEKTKHFIFKWTVIFVPLILLFFIVVRPFIRWISDSYQDSVDEMLPRTIEELEDLQSADSTLPGMSGALPILTDSIDPNKAESELLKQRIMSIMEADVRKSADAMSLWLLRRDK